MTLDRVTAFRDLAAFLRSERIPSCVLHGIDPESGVLGRDLDLYISDSRHAFLAAVQFSEILRRHGVRWVALMHPVWGPRCIGILEFDLSYWELHIVTRVSMACVDFGELFPIGGREGPHGFNFDPTLWFVKAVLQKYSNSFARGRPVWTRFPSDTFALAHKTEIENEFQKRWRHGAKFVSAVLGPGTDANLRTCRRGLFALMSWYCLAHPWKAARAAARWLYRKGNAYKCPTVPVIGIDTTMESSALRECLAEKLGHVFTDIVVADRPMPWRTRKWLQTRQSLLVLRCDERRNNQRAIDCLVSFSSSDQAGIDAGVAAILDCVVQYNRSWPALYEAMSLRHGKNTAAVAAGK